MKENQKNTCLEVVKDLIAGYKKNGNFYDMHSDYGGLDYICQKKNRSEGAENPVVEGELSFIEFRCFVCVAHTIASLKGGHLSGMNYKLSISLTPEMFEFIAKSVWLKLGVENPCTVKC